MLLAADIGNTQTVLGLFSRGELIRDWRISTEAQRTADELAVKIDGLLTLGGFSSSDISAFIVSSVVPKLNSEYHTMGIRYLGVKPLVVGPGVKTGMPILTNNPREVGSDLIVDAVGAFERYGGPCIVVDFGTATTFAAVSDQGEYLGGAIAPGIEISMDALAQKAAKLSRIELQEPESVIGKTTVMSMQAGALYGFSGQVDGVLRRMRTELGSRAVAVATGGLAELIFMHSEELDELDSFLTLHGLRVIYDRNR